MIDDIDEMVIPGWLANIGLDNRRTRFPLVSILKSSLYYPSSGFDGDPIKLLSRHFNSFVYVDYGNTKDELDEQLDDTGFNGYHIILDRYINKDELTPKLPSSLHMEHSDDPTLHSDYIKKPFVRWLVFERNEGLDINHGAERFSLLYICADGVAAFEALYLAHHCSPLGIAIIQPGYNFGMNWTQFDDPKGILANTVLNNPAGEPNVLLYGGMGKRTQYINPCWPRYSKHICFLEKSSNGSIGIWVHQ